MSQSKNLSTYIARNCGLFAFLTSLILPNAVFAQQPAKDDPTSKLQTVGGVLRVVPGEDNIGKALVLGKKKIQEIEEIDFISLGRKFSIGGHDVVLVSSQCGGSACSVVGWNFLTITPQGRVTVSPPMFASDLEEPVIDASKDRILIKVSERDGRRKKTTTWVYANGTAKESR